MDSKRSVLFQEGAESQEGNFSSFSREKDPINNQTNYRLRRMLSANDIKHTSAKCVIKLLAFGLKKMQLFSQERQEHCSSKQPLFLKDLEESISEIRKAPFRRERSLLLVRQSRANLEGRGRAECRRSLEDRHRSEKAQLLDEIAARLEGNSKAQIAQQEGRKQYDKFGKRIANLQSFMKKIKRERAQNDQPAVIYQKTIIPRANSHKLLLALELERKRAAESKDSLVFQALLNVRHELQKVRQSQQKLLSKSSQSSLSEAHNTHLQLTPNAANPIQGSSQKDFTFLEEQRRKAGVEGAKRQSVSLGSNHRFTFSFDKLS